MRIYDALQGHLAQLVGRELHTLAQEKKFRIERVVPENEKQVDWLIKLAVGRQGNEQSIYLTDILRVYTWMVSNNWGKWTSVTDMERFITSSPDIVSKKNASYMMAILATFDDIESRKGQGSAIRFKPKSLDYRS
jgi:hypothetical protein